MKNKIIKEQDENTVNSEKDTLTKAKNLGCIPAYASHTYYLNDTDKVQGLKTFNPSFKGVKSVYYGGKNEKGSLILWSSDMKVYNFTKGTSANWTCEGLELSKDKTSDSRTISSDQQALITRFVQNNPNYVEKNPGAEKIGPGLEFETVDVNTVLPQIPKGKYVIYKRTGIVGKGQDYVRQFETLLRDAGYTFNVPDPNDEYLLQTKRKATDILGNNYANQFGNTIPFVYLKKETWTELENLDRKACREAIKTLYTAFKDPSRSSMVLGDRISLKNKVWWCNNRKYGSGILGVGDEMKTILSTTPAQNKFGMKGYEPTKQKYNESRDGIIKSLIKENLKELSESKKKSLVEEYNIINLRFNIITESGKPKTKKQKEKFADDIINEIFYLKSQGFNETLINEQFFDILKSFFGQIPGGIFGTLKERFAQFILSKLGLDTEGYLANIFITTIGNIPLGDYANGKIFNCEYISNAISKGVGEGIARKIQKEQGMEGPFYDTVRNAMVDMFTDSKFGDKIEKAVGQMICPSLPKIKERFASAGEAMKEKALS
jgi:hypothetical protein